METQSSLPKEQPDIEDIKSFDESHPIQNGKGIHIKF